MDFVVAAVVVDVATAALVAVVESAAAEVDVAVACVFVGCDSDEVGAGATAAECDGNVGWGYAEGTQHADGQAECKVRVVYGHRTNGKTVSKHRTTFCDHLHRSCHSLEVPQPVYPHVRSPRRQGQSVTDC